MVSRTIFHAYALLGVGAAAAGEPRTPVAPDLSPGRVPFAQLKCFLPERLEHACDLLLGGRLVDAGPITAEMRKEDPRLNGRVSLSFSRISIGELSQQLASRSAVGITVDARDPATGEHIAAILRHEPLADAMNAVWSLMSYRNRPRWRALRFRQSDTTVGGRLQRDIVVELMTPERQWRPVAGYLLKAPDRR